MKQEALFDTTDQKVLSVSTFLDFVNELLGIEGLYVQGEISSWNVHPSGIYFTLKDKTDGSVLDCYMSPYVYRGLGIVAEEGLEVKIGGMPSIYKAKGRFSFKTETMELMGEGSLKKAYELLKLKLQDEGLFDRKRPLPEFIQRIGLITSRTGAVIADFRKNVAQLGLTLSLYDARVEGAQAVGNILKAITWFNAHHDQFDVLVIMRGGGSLEDMQAFNNELVARAVFASKIPTICAIGHDRDVPIVSLVGDTATSTPTAAAILVNSTWDSLRVGLPQYQRDLLYQFETILEAQRSLVDVGSMVRLYEQILAAQTQRLDAYATYLNSVSPERNLKLGYSILQNTAGKIIKDIKSLKTGQDVTARLVDGQFVSTVKSIIKQ